MTDPAQASADATPRIIVPPVAPAAETEDAERPERRTVRLAVPAAAPGSPPPTALRASYAIIEKIGDGGMGVVYLARDLKLGRYVAIKRLNRAAMEDASLRSRFLREAEAIAALHHSHIVHVYSLAEDEEGPYIVMEYVAGPQEASPGKTPPRPYTLADRVHRGGPLAVTESLGLMIKVCRAVEYAHAGGVIHRDLKPSNVLLDEAGEPKIVDFGLAHRAPPDGGQPLTVPGERMLSLGYGAPEQEQDASTADERADVYGLGAILYFSLTGQNPRFFREKDLPEALRIPVTRALETDPRNRWPRVADYTEALLVVHAPSAVALPNVKTTWRCKWCDTINPTAIQFCGRCGWNGGETCAECGLDTRFGMQYCGYCGADAREYERVTNLRRALQEQFDKKAFELVEQQAGQISVFKPSGPNGQGLVDQVISLRENAHLAIDRRKVLRAAIDREFKQDNFERVQKCINEYKGLSDDRVYDDMLRNIPGWIAARDLERARTGLRHGQIDYVEQVCREVLAHVAPGSSEARALLAQARRRRILRRVVRAAATALGVILVYLLSAAPVYRLMGRPRSAIYGTVYDGVIRLRQSAACGPWLQRYAELFGAEGMFGTDKQP